MAILLLVLFATLFTTGVGIPGFMTSFAHAIGQPFWKAQPMLRAEVSGALKLFGSKGELVADNMFLEEQLNRAKLIVTDYFTVSDENKRLQDLLNRNSEKDFLAAGVLLNPNASLYDTLVIDVGTENRVSVGDTVFASERIVIGEIDFVKKYTSHVRLFSSPEKETQVVLENSGISLKAVGNGGGNILIEPSRGVSVEVGENVLLPGLFSYLIGTISSIESNPADAVQKVLLRLPVNIYTIREVFVEL